MQQSTPSGTTLALSKFWLDLYDAYQALNQALTPYEQMDRAAIAAIIFDGQLDLPIQSVPQETIQERLARLAEEGFREV